MKRMIRNYHLSFIDRRWLELNNFRFDLKSQLYVLNFSAFKWNKYTTLEGVMTVDLDNKDLWIDVYTKNKKEYYDAFYGVVYGNYDEILKKIYRTIEKQTKGMGIKVKYEYN